MEKREEVEKAFIAVMVKKEKKVRPRVAGINWTDGLITVKNDEGVS
jgi:hypothetical protein